MRVCRSGGDGGPRVCGEEADGLTECTGERLTARLCDRRRNTLFGNKDGRASNHPRGAHGANRLTVVVRIELYALGKVHALGRCRRRHSLSASGAL